MSERASYQRAGRWWIAELRPRMVGGTWVRPPLTGYGSTRPRARRALNDAIKRWDERCKELADALALAMRIAHKHGLPIDLVVVMARSLYSRTPGSEWSRVTGRPPPKAPKRARRAAKKGGRS